MAEKNPFLGLGLQQLGNEQRWIDLSPPEGKGTSPLGVLLGGALSKIKQAFASEEQPEVGVAPPAPTQQFQPATQFPELFAQQYVTPYKPSYQAPTAVPPPLQGFMTPGQINPQNPMGGIPPLQGFRQPNQMQQMQQDPNNVVMTVWGPNPLRGQ